MATVLPFVPETITVHLGAPRDAAPNVTVDYLDYLKNVAASELYPTWETAALRANILAINSYALNRIYTEYYRSRGYDFDITSTTAFDQSFVEGRSTFETTDRLAEELFDSYIRRVGFVEPLAAKFCNGTSSVCDGLSQWGSQALAEQGYNCVQILQSYYGEDVEIVSDAPVRGISPSYPGTLLQIGSSGSAVTTVQSSLNTISQNYPAIPKITPVDGFYRESTEQAVRAFQQIFGLTVDGIVGKSTWYQLVRIYVAVKRLAELQSEGQTWYYNTWDYPDAIKLGDSGQKVEQLQYMLAVIADFVPRIPSVEVNGRFGEETRAAVLAFQEYVKLPLTGEAGTITWDAMYELFIAIETYIFRDAALFPFARAETATTIRQLQQQLRRISTAYPSIPAPPLSGILDQSTRQSIAAWQRYVNLVATGMPNKETLRSIADAAGDLSFADSTRAFQFPGRNLSFGQSDPPLTPEERTHPRLFFVGAPIRSLQTMLRAIGRINTSIPMVIPSGIYSQDTVRAVSVFQREYGLPVTGVVNLGTWNRVVEIYDDTLDPETIPDVLRVEG